MRRDERILIRQIKYRFETELNVKSDVIDTLEEAGFFGWYIGSFKQTEHGNAFARIANPRKRRDALKQAYEIISNVSGMEGKYDIGTIRDAFDVLESYLLQVAQANRNTGDRFKLAMKDFERVWRKVPSKYLERLEVRDMDPRSVDEGFLILSNFGALHEIVDKNLDISKRFSELPECVRDSMLKRFKLMLPLNSYPVDMASCDPHRPDLYCEMKKIFRKIGALEKYEALLDYFDHWEFTEGFVLPNEKAETYLKETGIKMKKDLPMIVGTLQDSLAEDDVNQPNLSDKLIAEDIQEYALIEPDSDTPYGQGTQIDVFCKERKADISDVLNTLRQIECYSEGIMSRPVQPKRKIRK